MPTCEAHRRRQRSWHWYDLSLVTAVPGGGVFKGTHFGVSLNQRGDLAFPGLVVTD
jgi:hypothetical protein